jgi:hypothetical protein
MFALFWKRSPDTSAFTDLIPSWWFKQEEQHQSLTHDVEGPRGGLRPARCSVTVREDSADLDYGGNHAAFNEPSWYIGVIRLVFEDSTRTRIKQVLWRDDGQRGFEEMTDELVEWSNHHLSVKELTNFDPKDARDGRQRINQLVAIRQGQPAFRKKLMTAYRRCAVTGCTIEQVLEAAHISPYRGDHTNHVTNGLLLRADVHTLFDLGLLKVHPNYRIDADDHILHALNISKGQVINLPSDPALHPNREALEQKAKES